MVSDPGDVSIDRRLDCIIAAGRPRQRPDPPDLSWRKVFARTAPREWSRVEIGGFSLTVPYSKAWRISDLGLSIVDVDSPNTEYASWRFGRPIDGGTFIAREYQLIRRSTLQLDEIVNDVPRACGDHTRGEIVTIAEITGVLHREGGTKGCATGLVFNVGGYTYFFYRSSDTGEKPADMSDEIKILVASVR